MAPTPSGKGYWLVASDGGVFTFGDAHFYGSLGGQALPGARRSASSPTKTGKGYWIELADASVVGARRRPRLRQRLTVERVAGPGNHGELGEPA